MNLKSFFTFLLVACLTSSFTNEKGNSYSLTVQVKNIKSNNGKILLALYSNKKDYLKKEIKGGVASIKNGIAYYVFKNISKGEYAVALFHDENNNKKMDKNFMGIPTEEYAFSNNVKAFMAAPKFEKTKFLIQKNSKITVCLD